MTWFWRVALALCLAGFLTSRAYDTDGTGYLFAAWICVLNIRDIEIEARFAAIEKSR